MEKKYNFENLVLLVGTNPLPNYVVGKYFLMNNPDLKKIWLVYSEKQNDFGTREIAERIKDVLNKDCSNFGFCPLEDISNARNIKKNVETNILDKLTGSVHLNYTGGTKAMAVHVYRAIDKYDKSSNNSFSYLDARKFVLIDDAVGIITNDLRKIININAKTFSFDGLINLHGYKKKSGGVEYGDQWNGVLEEFEKLINEKELGDYFKWKKLIRKIYYIKKNEKAIIDTDINKIRLRIKETKIKERLDNKDVFYNFDEHPFKVHALQILSKIPDTYSLLNNNSELYISDITNVKKQIKPSIEFLDGKWLENYIFQILKRKLKSINGDVPLELNWILEKHNANKDDKNFELDIILLNGYQIYGISITTDHDETRCKSKGFEIFHRVNQIGGEESKAILITCLDSNQVKKMGTDLNAETSSERLMVLGIEDLPEKNLLPKIVAFIGLKEAIC
ncbi:MAG: hypothetical protein WA144_06615 [Candidatus Methanoperedens sp.]